MKKFYLACAALLALMLLPGVCLAKDNTLNCTPPTKNTDGSNITGAISYKWYFGAAGSVKNTVLAATTVCTFVHANAPVGKDCYEVTAIVNAVESVHTAEACVDVAAPVPNPPSNLTIAQSAVFTLVKQRDRVVMTVVGSAPGDTPCVLTEAVIASGVQYNVVPRDAVTFSGTVKPEVVYAKCG